MIRTIPPSHDRPRVCRRRARAGQDPAPDALVRKSIDEVLVVIKADKELQNGNPKKIHALIEEKVLPHFNFTRMTRLAVGAAGRRPRTAEGGAHPGIPDPSRADVFHVPLAVPRPKIDVRPRGSRPRTRTTS